MDHYLQPPGWERMLSSLKSFWTGVLTFHLNLFCKQTAKTTGFVADNCQPTLSHCLSGFKTLPTASLHVVMQEYHSLGIFNKPSNQTTKIFARA